MSNHDPEPASREPSGSEDGNHSQNSTAVDVAFGLLEPIAWFIGGILRMLAWVFAAIVGSCS